MSQKETRRWRLLEMVFAMPCSLLHPVLLVLSREWSGLQMLYARNLPRENFCLVKWPRASGCTLFMVCKTK